ncbi:predicted protein [Sclerotinia sclerotiorum 1980 UF-70]|uniref:Uncharacterized protein n=1 Tax=Sclerotinia sclerotiorum (strain ATCC 18683 / 1980 / Ss-1) TaxID=665079 RepID=A7EEP5_SCLS1|nr:predicted protein [Sclerotinia sclerotiorum 1980 UF-70]EDO01311.1 predicted protein [Sclerotinia sclerotiorum 1980 UF-70]
MTLEEEFLISRANIVTPVRPFKESSKLMATSESESEIVAQSPLSDPFICSSIPFVYSPSPSPAHSPKATFQTWCYSEATPELEATPSTPIATEQSWIHRNSKTIKTDGQKDPRPRSFWLGTLK